MRLVSLNIRRMPGFKEKGFAYREGVLKEGINLILGSNGAGKTTSCMAVRKLFFPDHPSVQDFVPVSLQAIAEEGGNFFEFEVEGSRRILLPSIELPSSQEASCYTVLLDDLFSATDAEFAQAISKMAFGGCDLTFLKEQFSLPPRFGHKERRQLYDKKRTLEAVVRDHAELSRQEESLKELLNQVTEAKKAKETLEKIKIVRELESKKAALHFVETALKELLPGSAYAREEDLRLYQEVSAREAEEVQGGVIDDLKLIVLEESVQELQELERELREEKRRTLELQADSRERFSLLEVEKGDFPCIQISKVTEMQQLWENWHEKMCALKASETQLKILAGETEPSYSSEALREGIRLLGCYVREEEQKWLRSILFCTPLLSLFLYQHPYLCAGVALFSCAVLYLLRNSSSGFFKRAFLKLGIPSPTDWTVEEVEQHRVQLEAMWGETVRFFSDKETAQIIGIQKNMYKEEADTLYRNLHEAGFDHSKLSWIPFLHGLHRAQDLFFEMKKQEALVSDAEQKRQALLEKVGVKTTQEAIHVCTQSQKALQRARELKSLSARKKEILTRCKIEAATAAEEEMLLKKCIHEQKVYLHYAKEKAVLESAIREKEEALKAHVELLTFSSEDLQVHEETLQMQAALHDPLLQEIAAIRQKIESTGERDAFEKADAELKEAENVLKKAHAEFIYKAMGAFLLEKAEKLYARDFQPEVFKKAGVWFMRFTRGAYSLQLIQRHGFAAFDLRKQETCQIEELSRGTRIQLVLAVRLAFMENAEKGGFKLPLLLDEVLSHADDERFRYMVEALAEVARTGRQIFYFTCQKGDIEAWQRALPDPFALHVIDLDKMKQEVACIASPLKEREEECPFPSPEGKSLYTYANELKAPGLDPNEPPAAWHLCHFVNSAEELHALVLRKIECYGQFKHLVEMGLMKNMMIEAKGTLAEHYYALAQRGKGKKLTCEDLEKGGVSGKFLDKVLECAKLCDYDAHKLLHALENKQVPGFREKAREELETYFEEVGCLDRRQPFDAVAIRAQLWMHLTETSLPLAPEEAASFINTLCN